MIYTIIDSISNVMVMEMRMKTTSKRSFRIKRETFVGYAFLFPSIIGFSVFVVYPLLSSVYYALTRWNGASPPKFIGFRNFQYMFTLDPAFWPSLKATAIFVALSVPSSLALGLAFAILLNRQMPGVKLLRTVFYLPVVLPSIASLTLWKFIFNPQYGFANEILKSLGLPTSLWLGSTRMAIPAIVIIGLWGVGGTMIIFLAGLQAVPEELYEAARLDGAGSWSVFIRITLPMISPILFLQLVMQIIGSMQAFNQPAVLTGGGPGFTTDLFMYNIWQNAFQNEQFGYAVSQVWVLFILIMILTAIVFRFSTMWVYAENE